MRSVLVIVAAAILVVSACANSPTPSSGPAATSSTVAPAAPPTSSLVTTTVTTTTAAITTTTAEPLVGCGGEPPLTGQVPNGITILETVSAVPTVGLPDSGTVFRVWTWEDEHGAVYAELQAPTTYGIGDSAPHMVTEMEVAGYPALVYPDSFGSSLPWRLAWHEEPDGPLGYCSSWALTSAHLTSPELIEFAMVVLEDARLS